jgi:deoxyribonuclease-4
VKGAKPGQQPPEALFVPGPPGPVDGVFVGLAGAPASARRVGSAFAVLRCAEMGLDALEMAWVHGVSMGQAGAARVRKAVERTGLRLSVHAPYTISLNSHDPAVVAASRDRLVRAARAGAWCGATDVVVHCGSYHGDPPVLVQVRVADQFRQALEVLEREDLRVTLRPEVMGRAGQFGDLDEVLELCHAVPGLMPCIDIAHLHARSGGCNTKPEFAAIWEQVAGALGPRALSDVHVHMSGIEFGPRGERRHLALQAADLDYRGFLEVMAERGVRGLVVVESPGREGDAVLVARTWRQVAAAAREGC